MGRPNVTLADVATHLGVSRTTVSNAYNRPDQLSPELRERVLAAAGELGYCGPDPMARGLRRGRTGALGFVFDGVLSYMLTDAAAILFLQGVAAGCEEQGAALAMLPRLPGGPGASADVVRSALVDGYILFCMSEGDPRRRAVRARGLPHVLVEFEDDPTAAQVQIDDRAGAREAARHLAAHGHRRVGIVASYGDDDVVSAPAAEETAPRRVLTARLQGWRAGLEAAGVDWSAVPVSRAAEASVAGGASAAGRLLDRADRPTAILAMSDLLALGVLQAAAARGIEVPGRLSVVGFDDIPAAAGATPALTTVTQPHTEKGLAAVRLLAGGADPAQSVLLPCALVVRASSGPAPR
jgi:DNA-binding LacI/PurR family transcriptional regulator